MARDGIPDRVYTMFLAFVAEVSGVFSRQGRKRGYSVVREGKEGLRGNYSKKFMAGRGGGGGGWHETGGIPDRVYTIFRAGAARQ